MSEMHDCDGFGCVACIERARREVREAEVAPLLAALAPFARLLDEMEPGTDGTHIPVSVSMRELVAARAAIRKATGGAA